MMGGWKGGGGPQITHVSKKIEKTCDDSWIQQIPLASDEQASRDCVHCHALKTKTNTIEYCTRTST